MDAPTAPTPKTRPESATEAPTVLKTNEARQGEEVFNTGAKRRRFALLILVLVIGFVGAGFIIAQIVQGG
ncbi:MAG: hypothetical protein ACFB2Z_00060 [Maricaulaceae bacterium]